MTKKSILFLFLLITGIFYGQQWQTATIQHSSGLREYSIYVPSNYNSQNPASLVITLHGLGDTMNNFRNIGFAALAETNNIIVICPQALSDPLSGTAWNSGAGYPFYTPNANVDDVGFISSLIDSVKQTYSINPNKVFACGFSMGGFMTERLALFLNDKIKVFASVAGTFGNGILPVAAGTPGRPVSIAHFHGTSDATIGYSNNNFGNSVDQMINYWKNNNLSNSTPVHTLLPNTANDGLTVDHYKYTSPSNNSVIELYKVNNADHVWLTPQNDISYTQKIWEFFTQNSSNLSVSEVLANDREFSVYPLPAKDFIHLRFPKNYSDIELAIYDLTGKLMLSEKIKLKNNTEYTLDLKAGKLIKGNYLLTVKNDHNPNPVTKKIIIN
ncbi:T9SS type A sorting domain-containing protein [Chryseobacterium sp. JV558]|uniref:T9SS type A sorting domain-containing protein n=1 Tax=Chryseobacterium sp. JV558 TaxID=2663236 RepID=UPI00299E4C9B|nr:T9SS type A sorting domain-containing protein [Chryseobacterium sp. JV558]MDW9378877.1 T9SS type A sorting domain-containing protein [Chryseobacterium sp. JV558]